MSSKTLTGSQLRKFRSDIAKLKSKGLVSARVDARSQKPTRHMQEQIKKYSDVLAGKATVVKVPRAKDARKFETLRHKGKSVVVTPLKNERVRYDKKTGNLIGKRERDGGKPVTRLLGVSDPSQVKGERVRYSIPLGRPGERWTFDSWEELQKFFAEYEKENRYPNWPKYVEIEIV